MMRVLPIACLGACLGLLVAASLPTAAPAQQVAAPWQGDRVLDDPEWRKRFLGSYGFLSGAEPQINPSELEVLKEVIDLLKVNPQAAEASLAARTGENSSAALDFILANLEFQNQKFELAIVHYKSALAKFPDFRRAHKNLGLLLVQKQDYKGAVEHLSKAVELGDRDGRNYGLLGFCYLNLENHLAAEQAYRSAILADPETRDWKLGLARALLAIKKREEAVALFQSLIEAEPSEPTAWMLQANAYLELDQPLAAAVNLEAVRMMGKAEPSSLVLLGDIYMNAQMYGLAKDAYLEVIRRDEKGASFATAFRAAELLVRTGSHAEANEILASIDQRYGPRLDNADELKVLTLKAKVARAEGRPKEGAAILESIVERDGTRGDALLELADYYQDQGDVEKALLLIERAQNLRAYEYQALLKNAQVQVSQREYARAASLLRQALAIRSEPRVESFLARVEDAIRRR